RGWHTGCRSVLGLGSLSRALSGRRARASALALGSLLGPRPRHQAAAHAPRITVIAVRDTHGRLSQVAGVCGREGLELAASLLRLCQRTASPQLLPFLDAVRNNGGGALVILTERAGPVLLDRGLELCVAPQC